MISVTCILKYKYRHCISVNTLLVDADVLCLLVFSWCRKAVIKSNLPFFAHFLQFQVEFGKKWYIISINLHICLPYRSWCDYSSKYNYVFSQLFPLINYQYMITCIFNIYWLFHWFDENRTVFYTLHNTHSLYTEPEEWQSSPPVFPHHTEFHWLGLSQNLTLLSAFSSSKSVQ